MVQTRLPRPLLWISAMVSVVRQTLDMQLQNLSFCFFVAGIIGIFLFKTMESDDDKEARANKKAQKKALKNAKKGA